MSDVNTVTVSGRLTRDPELRHTNSGTAVCNIGIASSRSRKQDDGSYAEETSFFDGVVWSGFGELVARKLQKGDLVTVSGRLQQRSWEGDDGTKRSKVEIVVNDVSGQGMYRTKDEETANAPFEAATGAEAVQPKLSQGTSDDDIPF